MKTVEEVIESRNYEELTEGQELVTMKCAVASANEHACNALDEIENRLRKETILYSDDWAEIQITIEQIKSELK